MQYGAPGTTKAVRCANCKKDTDIGVYRRFCQGELHPPGDAFRVTVHPQTDYLCSVCRNFDHRRCEKEREVVAYLLAHVPDHEPSLLNKTIRGNLTLKYRPDIYYDLGDRALIVEVDEYQHTSYPVGCEAKRMLEITMTLGTPVVFLRYNPDKYRDPGGVARCVGKSRRLADLEEKVLYWANRSVDQWPRFFRATYLWYSEKRENACRHALDATLGDVFTLHPELRGSDHFPSSYG